MLTRTRAVCAVARTYGAGVHGVLVDPFDDWRDDACPRTRSTAELARALLDARGAVCR